MGKQLNDNSKESKVSDATKNLLRQGSRDCVQANAKQLKAVPGVVAGAVDIAGGTKVAGAVKIAKEVPGVAMAKVQETKGKVNLSKALVSAKKDMEGMTREERMQYAGDFIREGGNMIVDNTVGEVKKTADDVKDFTQDANDWIDGKKTMKEITAENAAKEQARKLETKLEDSKEMQEYLEAKRDIEVENRLEDRGIESSDKSNFLPTMPVGELKSASAKDAKQIISMKARQDAATVTLDTSKQASSEATFQVE